MFKDLEEKKCLECGLEKPFEEFYRTKKGYYSYCKTCHTKFNQEKTVSLVELTKKYGISTEDLYILLEKQDGKCKICLKEIIFKTQFRQNRACVDHEEGTLNIRGLLCIDCNMAIGILKHDTNLLHSAISYLHSPVAFIGDREKFSRIRRNKKRINTSGYLGVTFDKSHGKYKAKLVLLGKSVNIGYYNFAIEAAIAYNNYVRENVPDYERIITLNDVPLSWALNLKF